MGLDIHSEVKLFLFFMEAKTNSFFDLKAKKTANFVRFSGRNYLNI